jgi:hypothetical protein
MNNKAIPFPVVDEESALRAIRHFLPDNGRGFDLNDFLAARAACLESLRREALVVGLLTTESYLRLAPAAAPVDYPDDTDQEALLYTRDGRKVTGTAEQAQGTGRLRALSRAEDGKLECEFTGVVGGDFDFIKTPDGQLLFRVEDSEDLVPESDLVIVGPSRVSEFLASIGK